MRVDTGEQLMARVAREDWGALEALLGRYEAALFGFFHRLGCAPASCEDLVQSVMIRLYEARRGYDASRPFPPWLYGIAWNVWNDYRRRHARESSHLVSVEAIEDAPSLTADPLERSQQVEEAERVRRALQRLPEEQRMTLILRHYQGLTYEEIAEALGIPLGTVKWRIHEAMHKVKEWLAVRARGRLNQK